MVIELNMKRFDNIKMTRVCKTLFLLFIPILIKSEEISIESPLFMNALSLLENYSPYTSNLTHIKYLLEISEQENDYDALQKLGEFWLLGYPISYENPNVDTSIVKDGKFSRNIDLAMFYFKKALSKSSDAGHFVSLILQQSLLINSFDKYLPAMDTPITTIKSLEDSSIQKMSSMAIAASIFHFERCLASEKIPEFLLQGPNPFIRLPYYQFPMCGYSCEKLAYLALAPATKSLEYIFRNHKESTYIRPIGEEAGIYGKDAKNWLKMYEKSIRNHPQSMSALGQYYIKGNPMLGVEPEINTGIELLERAAQTGEVQAHENLGVLYSKGHGVEKNYTKAVEHLNIAFNKGSIIASALLGEMYLYGQGVEVDKIKGLGLLKSAASQGNIESITTLGTYFFLEKD